MVKMDPTLLKHLVQSMIILKEKLKCPICLDVITDVVELECGHRYCNECYSQHKATKDSCPLCKTVIKRRSTLYKDDYANSLGQFVRNICCDIQKQYNCEVEQLKDLNEVQILKRKVLDDVTVNQNINVQCTSGNKNIKLKSELSKENREDAFNTLRNPTSLLNRSGIRRVYKNLKIQNQEKHQQEQEDFEFVEDYDKKDVIKWLNDTQNAFDRVTQTQNVENEAEETNSDLVSISQVKEKRKKFSANKSGRNVRARSLDVEIRKVVPKEKTRKSLGDRSEANENYNIEEINTEEKVIKKVEEKVILDIIEDDYLDKLESEIQGNELRSEKKLAETKKDNRNKWEGKGKIDRSIKKREKEKLNVTLQSTQTSKNGSKDKEKTNLISIVKNNARSDDNIREIDKSNCDDSEEVENVNIRTYDLHKIENYIANNIKVIEKNASLDDSTTPPPSEKNNNQELDKQIEASTDKIDIVDEDLPLGNITKKTVNEESDNHVLINIIDNLEIEECIQKRTNNNFSQPQQNDIIILEDSDSNDFDGIIQQKSTDFPKSRVSTDDTLNLLEELVNRCITNLNATTPDIIRNQLSNMLTQILKLKTFINPQKIASCNSWAQTNIETDNVAVQTRVDNNVATVQTDVHVHTVAIQTQIDKREVAVQTYFNVNSTAIQTEYIDCFRCQDREINSLVHSQNPKNRMVSITNKQINNFDTTEHSIESNKSKPSSQNDIFSATLDNLIFDTQEISKNQGIILKSTQKHICQGVSYPPSTSAHERKISQSNKEMSQQLLPSVLVCTVESSSNSNNVNRKLIYEPDRSRFKRIRAPTSDSDSDGETEPKKLCNRFVRDDLTVEFQTNSVAHNESQNSDNINYDDYLTKVMKKYEDSMCNTPAKEALDTPASKKKFIKEIVNKCEDILDSASRNIVHIKEMADISTSSKDSFQTASQSINNLNDVLAEDNVFIEDNLRKMENDIRDYEIANLKAHNTESSDIVVNTDDIAPAPKKVKKCNDKYNDAQSASLFSRSEHVSQKRTISEDKVCDELNDSFDDAIWENINICEAELYANRDDKGTKASKITVINNVVLKSPKKRLLNMEEDDLFSDEDIVETTPQKKTNSFAERSILSQINNIPTYPDEELPKPLTETENFEFDVTTLPPPPDFQDTCQRPDSESEPSNNDTDDHTILNHPSILANLNKSSLTPDELSQFIAIRNSDQYQGLSPCITSCTKETKIKGNSSLTPNKFRSQLDNDMEKRKILHSTPVTQRKADMQTLGFSPIEVKHVECTESISKVQKKLPEKKRQHDSLIDLAQSSKYMPLSFVSKDTPKKHNILTSIPNQKSIWNYVRPAGSMEVKETLKKSKPEIACSRLTKAQIDDIQYEMVEKGLSTYSSMFSMSVTHMVVAVNEDNCLIDYTTKFVAAVAAGIWVLRFEWIEECLRRNCIVEEEPYEVLDPNGSMGAKTSRLTRKANPLFKGYKFYCADPFISITKDEIKEIITLLGGKVVANIHDLLVNDGHIVLIIKGEGNATEEFEVCERWIKVYKAVTVDLVWLSKCVGQYRVATVRPYILGDEEENLEELNYPSHLLELVPLSLSETL